MLFFGSDTFSVRVLNHLLKADLCPIRVVTKPRTLLERFSADKQLDRYYWPQGVKLINDFNIGLVASFGNLIDESTIERFKFGLFNVHPSLLPQYRGSTPVQTAILEGIRQTGCTIMRIPPIAKFDIGEIVLQEKLDIREREYAMELRDRLADLGATLAERLLLNYDECMSNMRSQGNTNRSYARNFKPEIGELDFGKETSNTLDRRYRALHGFVDLYVFVDHIKVRLEDMFDPTELVQLDLNRLAGQLLKQEAGQGDLVIEDSDIGPGTIYFHKLKRLLCIKCCDNRWLAFGYATPKGKTRMTAADFYNGYLSRLSQRDRRVVVESTRTCSTKLINR